MELIKECQWSSQVRNADSVNDRDILQGSLLFIARCDITKVPFTSALGAQLIVYKSYSNCLLGFQRDLQGK